MEVSDAKRLNGLEDENRRLKKLLAEAMPDNAALNDVPGKNGSSLRQSESGCASWNRAPSSEPASRTAWPADRKLAGAVSRFGLGAET